MNFKISCIIEKQVIYVQVFISEISMISFILFSISRLFHYSSLPTRDRVLYLAPGKHS